MNEESRPISAVFITLYIAAATYVNEIYRQNPVRSSVLSVRELKKLHVQLLLDTIDGYMRREPQEMLELMWAERTAFINSLVGK